MDENTKILQQIDQYISGELRTEEIDALWIEFLRNQEYFDYLVTLINLKEVISKK